MAGDRARGPVPFKYCGDVQRTHQVGELSENPPSPVAGTSAKPMRELSRCTGRRSIAFACRMTAAVLLPAAMAHALEPSTPLANFSRQAWGMENGLPQNTVQALAQTADGYLWLGTEVGLVRFDGNGFTLFDRNSRPALPGNDVRYLLATQDGALWIGTGDGLARLKDGAVRVFTAKDGLPGNEVRRLGRDPDGSYWVSTESGTAVISGDRLVGVGGDEFKNRNSAIVDAVRLKGGLWAQATATAVTVGRGDKPELRFEVGHELPGTRVQRLLADREGALWIGTNAGLVRWVGRESGGKLQLLAVTDPLAHASVLALTEDAEGNIWAGTEADGLHILRDQRFKSYGAREGLSSDATSTVVEGDAGKLWIGTNGGGLNVLRLGADTQGLAKTYTMPDVLLSGVILSLAAARNGDLWVGTPDGLNRIRGSAVDSFTNADGLPDDFIRSLLADADGSLWIGTRRGLAHWTFRAGARDCVASCRANDGLYAGQRPGQRPGGRDGAGLEGRPVGGNICRPVAHCQR